MKDISCILPVVKDYKGDLNARWYVEFWFVNPENNKLERIKKYKGINHEPTVQGRLKAANEVCQHWKLKLESGFNPYDRDDVLYTNHNIYEKDEWMGREVPKDFKIEFYCNKVLDHKKLMLQRGNLRLKTYQAYLTKSRALCKFLEEMKWDNKNIRDFKVEHARAFMEHMWKTVKHNQTWNMYNVILRLFWTEMNAQYPRLQLGNPWKQISLLKADSQPATAFSTTQIEKIKTYLEEKDPYLLMICEVVYYCFIRPCSELPLLQVKDLNFDLNTIKVPGSIAKNKKTESVKVPKQLMDKFISLQLGKYPENFHLFTHRGVPFESRSGRDYFSKRFKKVLIALGFAKGYSMYSWKHTGNERLAMTDIPVKFMQLQNRHHSLDQTATYQQSVQSQKSNKLYESFPTL